MGGEVTSNSLKFLDFDEVSQKHERDSRAIPRMRAVRGVSIVALDSAAVIRRTFLGNLLHKLFSGNHPLLNH